MWTFPQYYYFRKGTLSERRFTTSQNGPVTKQPGVYYPKGTPDIAHNRERRSKQEVTIPKQETSDDSTLDEISRPVVPNSRITESDKKNDTKSLERKLPRTLYLLVKDSNGWKLPSFATPSNTPLHIAAEAGLRQLGGEIINTWTVSNTPAAVLKYNNNKLVDSKDSSEELTREYIIKSHILSGIFKPSEENVEYEWLVKEEIKERVGEDYYKATEFLFSEV